MGGIADSRSASGASRVSQTVAHPVISGAVQQMIMGVTVAAAGSRGALGLAGRGRDSVSGDIRSIIGYSAFLYVLDTIPVAVLLGWMF